MKSPHISFTVFAITAATALCVSCATGQSATGKDNPILMTVKFNKQ